LKNTLSEAHIQAVLMPWLLEKRKHIIVFPNSREFFSWEADLISITRSYLAHEFEIKLNMGDYKADAKKHKHNLLGDYHGSPSYFWYVTYNFQIMPPENSGWIIVVPVGERMMAEIRKEAPRLHSRKVFPRKI
jgi:hypothetical protein